ncbi:MAG: crosslink repair DNA glycosylase YcaQ family protein [Armatimonadota bacterium]
MIDVRLLAYLGECQGLSSFTSDSSAAVLAENGWARTVGGANPYLSLFARNQASRESVDADVASLSIHEFASARGCTYLLPAEHFQVGIKCGQGYNAESALRTARSKLGVTDEEVDALKEGILLALAGGPLDAAALKEPLGSLYKHYGEAGKKIGQTTNVSLGLLALQAGAKIRRIPSDGRLDGQTYKYCLYENAPVVDEAYPQALAFRHLARLFWSWCGFASIAHFQWFSGLGVKGALSAIEGLGLIAVEGTPLLSLPSAAEAFRDFRMPADPTFRLVSGLDSLFLLRRDLSLHIFDEQVGLDVLSQRKLATLGSLNDLSTNAIVDRGRIVGLWEYDFDSKEIVWVSFVGSSSELLEEVRRVESFISTELGDARSFSLDSPKSRQPSIARLREMAAAG